MIILCIQSSASHSTYHRLECFWRAFDRDNVLGFGGAVLDVASNDCHSLEAAREMIALKDFECEHFGFVRSNTVA